LGISSEQDAKPAAWLRLTHYKDCAIIDIKLYMPNSLVSPTALGLNPRLKAKVEDD